MHIRLGTQDEYVCLNQIRTTDYRRLYSKIGQIDTDDSVGSGKRFGGSINNVPLLWAGSRLMPNVVQVSSAKLERK